MQRPLKWKLFNLANYLLLIFFGISIVGLLLGLFQEGIKPATYRVIGVMIGAFLVTANYGLNIFILRNYFPNKLLTKGIKIANLILLIFSTLFWLVIVIAFFAGLTEEMNDEYSTGEGIFILWILGILITIKAFALFLQLKMQSTLSKNYRESMLDLIDTLGDEKPRDIFTN